MLKPGTTQKRLSQTPTTSRASARIAVGEPVHREDADVKRRRMQVQVTVLEQDNAITDPHADLKWHKALPKFNDEMVYDQGGKAKSLQQGKHQTPLSSASLFEVASKKGKKLRMELTKVRMRKNFAQQLQECEAVAQKNDANAVTYSKCAAPPSRRPPKKFCAVCGFRSKYNCTKCGAHYCSLPCRSTHAETRCKKWTA
ncbi:HIT zinc finger family protein [Aphelenchoides avenae]|nr:HIT zinc finger family protein [Aphelenchus avenae]